MRRTDNYKLNCLQAGDILYENDEVIRWSATDNNLYGPVNICGNGIIEGWNVRVDLDHIPNVIVSPGRGIVGGVFVNTEVDISLNLNPGYSYKIVIEAAKEEESTPPIYGAVFAPLSEYKLNDNQIEIATINTTPNFNMVSNVNNDVLIVYNTNSSDSLAVANYYKNSARGSHVVGTIGVAMGVPEYAIASGGVIVNWSPSLSLPAPVGGFNTLDDILSYIDSTIIQPILTHVSTNNIRMPKHILFSKDMPIEIPLSASLLTAMGLPPADNFKWSVDAAVRGLLNNAPVPDTLWDDPYTPLVETQLTFHWGDWRGVRQSFTSLLNKSQVCLTRIEADTLAHCYTLIDRSIASDNTNKNAVNWIVNAQGYADTDASTTIQVRQWVIDHIINKFPTRFNGTFLNQSDTLVPLPGGSNVIAYEDIVWLHNKWLKARWLAIGAANGWTQNGTGWITSPPDPLLYADQWQDPVYGYLPDLYNSVSYAPGGMVFHMWSGSAALSGLGSGEGNWTGLDPTLIPRARGSQWSIWPELCRETNGATVGVGAPVEPWGWSVNWAGYVTLGMALGLPWGLVSHWSGSLWGSSLAVGDPLCAPFANDAVLSLEEVYNILYV